ncbi:hypothetical protein CB0101_08960 [Synechococcus sp. CB0101]|uniref:SxtJ family membrane protein n=1 Tax=Synechococcus sp. CB0101 TaxID=232348 RepID=UPI00020019E1|nr:SxtJ family membrane protein [Synechococcus sp. CB0101]QCH15040.1 hypothetical protein CB0101_08960 [Synechococcus sp. CB0101]
MANNVAHPVPSIRQLREFGLVVGSLIAVVFGWLLPALHRHPPIVWPFWVGIPLFILGLCAPSLLRHPYRAWMALGHALGWVNGRIVLGVVYWVVLQPIALVMRLSGHDPLRRRWDPSASTYRELRKPGSINLNTPF